MYHCGDMCIPLTDDTYKRHKCSVEYFSNSSGTFEHCEVKFNNTCITNFGDCLLQAKSGVLLTGLCTYKKSTSLIRQLCHISCDFEKGNTWLNSCTTLVEIRSQSALYNTTNPSE